MKWLFRIIMIILGCYLSGVRVHPDNLKKYFEYDNQQGYVEILLNSGNRVAGRKVAETADALTLRMGRGTTVFQKREIARANRLDPTAVRAGQYDDVIIRGHSGRKPLWTVRYEDSIFSVIEKKTKQVLSRTAEKFGGPAGNALNLKQIVSDAMPGAIPAGPVPAAPAAEGQDYSAMIKAGLEQLKKQS